MLIVPVRSVPVRRSKPTGPNQYVKMRTSDLVRQLNQEELVTNPNPTLPEVEESFEKWNQEVADDLWRDMIQLEGIIEGYVINRDGQVQSPNGTLLKAAVNGGTARVQLRREGVMTSQPTRLDKLMLWTFDNPDLDGIPIHVNGDPADCRLSNLKWDEDAAIVEDEPVIEKPVKAKTTKATKKLAPTGGRLEVKVSSLYECGGLTVRVDDKGVAKLPKVTMTPANMLALAAINEKVNEMNRMRKLS